MRRTTTLVLFGAACGALFAPAARAATCSFDADQGIASVSVNGDAPKIKVSSTGAIHVDSAQCGIATVHNTTLIEINGGNGDDKPTIDLRYPFAPGANGMSSPDDVPAIAWTIALGAGRNTLTVRGSAGDDHLVLGANGINLDVDDDVDIAVVGVTLVDMQGLEGADFISAAGGFGTGAPFAGNVTLNGGAGDDFVLGGAGADALYGGDGEDVLSGNDGNDTLNGGAGDDYEDGGPGADFFNQGNASNGSDILEGGDGIDVVSYANRPVAVVVTLDGVNDDGDMMGEMDNVLTDVENVRGGAGEDYIMGNAQKNELIGGEGMDWIEGGGGNDTINGGGGDDYLFGGDGDDSLVGGAGNDRLFGGAGNDKLYGNDGDDHLFGQDGVNQYFCGSGADKVNGPESSVPGDCEQLSNH